MRVLNTLQMQKLEDYTENKGVPKLLMMENAARGVCDYIIQNYPDVNVHIFCGMGNNAGDGYAVAKLLFFMGRKVNIYSCGDIDKQKPDAYLNYNICKNLNIPIHDAFTSTIDNDSTDIILDCLFGIGLSRELSDKYKQLINKINRLKGHKIGIDIPSGIYADNGQIAGNAVICDDCITFEHPKTGHFLYPGRSYCKNLIIRKIGLANPDCLPSKYAEIYINDAHRDMPIPDITAHKGSMGRCILVAGSRGMSGAAILAAGACLKSGAGLVSVCVPQSIGMAIEKNVIEAMSIEVPEKNGALIPSEKLYKSIENADCIAYGPGIGRNIENKEILEHILDKPQINLVLDADGLFYLKDCLTYLAQHKGEVVITPHPGEMNIITGIPIDEIVNNRIDVACKFAHDTNTVVLLKGASTVVASPEGDVYINTTGNQGMATGGSGDCLTGIITALMARGIKAYTAAKLGCYIHGLAGDLAMNESGYSGMTATDILKHIPFAIKQLQQK